MKIDKYILKCTCSIKQPKFFTYLQATGFIEGVFENDEAVIWVFRKHGVTPFPPV